MKKICIILFVSLGFANVSSGQKSTDYNNNVFLEVGVLGGYTLNYERNLYLSKSTGLSAGVGIRPSLDLDEYLLPIVPLRINAFYSEGGKMFHLGFGFYNMQSDSRSLEREINVREWAYVGIIGLKFSVFKSRMQLGFTVNPVFKGGYTYIDGPIWGSMKLGYRFGKISQ